jgi:hypothetical protein
MGMRVAETMINADFLLRFAPFEMTDKEALESGWGGFGQPSGRALTHAYSGRRRAATEEPLGIHRAKRA